MKQLKTTTARHEAPLPGSSRIADGFSRKILNLLKGLSKGIVFFLVTATCLLLCFRQLQEDPSRHSRQRSRLVEGPISRLSSVTADVLERNSHDTSEQDTADEDVGGNVAQEEVAADITAHEIAVQAKSKAELPLNETMRACIFFGNDNHYLAEWIAYHYTVLPLRYLIVGVDENVEDDPNDILQRWDPATTGLYYEVWYPRNYTQNITYDSKDPLKRFRRRQPHFYARCMQHYYIHDNRGWISLVDTDEYIKLNPLDDDLNARIYGTDTAVTTNEPPKRKPSFKPDERMISETRRHMVPNETLWDRIAIRKELRQRLGLEPAWHSDRQTEHHQKQPSIIPTVVQVLDEYHAKHGLYPCYTMARLRYSAVVDNFTTLSNELCRPRLNDANTMSSSFVESANSKLSTIRFLYHAEPGPFLHNEWAKVLIDLRRMPSYESMGKVWSPHQPFGRECKHAYIHDIASFVHANHYVNDLSLFLGRKGDRRNRTAAEWEKMGLLRERVRCDQMHGWLNEFVATFGEEQAKYMLGLTTEQ